MERTVVSYSISNPDTAFYGLLGPVDPGDPATFVLTLTNVGDPAGGGPAFDLAVGDVLPPEFTLNPSTLSYTINGVAATPSSVSSSAKTSSSISINASARNASVSKSVASACGTPRERR